MKTSSVRSVVVAVALVAFAAGAFAAVSQKFQEWGAGPAQWLMTRQESAAWKNIQTDDDAQKFVDLFWARRDPTPGTPRNEYHETFDSRVQFADANFAEKDKRGAMSQRGRILVVMGEWSSREVLSAAAAGAGAGSWLNGKTASTQGEHNREHWLYEGEAAKRLGVYPRSATVYFVQGDSNNATWQMDVQKIAAWAVAQDNAVKMSIVAPDLTVAPVYAQEAAVENQAPVQMKGMTTTTTTRRVVLPDAPVVKDSLTGVTGLLLTRSNTPIGSPAAPFVPAMFTQDATAGSLKLTPADELSWAFEIRNPGEEAIDQPKIEVGLDVNGTVNGEPVHMSSPAEQIPADPMRKTPGHFTVRGSVPLSDFTPGTYTLTLNVRDDVKNETYKLQRQFVVAAR